MCHADLPPHMAIKDIEARLQPVIRDAGEPRPVVDAPGLWARLVAWVAVFVRRRLRDRRA